MDLSLLKFDRTLEMKRPPRPPERHFRAARTSTKALLVRMIILLGSGIAGLNLAQAQAPAVPLQSGLSVTFRTPPEAGNEKADYQVLSNIWLYVSSGHSPTPFLKSGKFTAFWSGFVSVDLRADYNFQVELNGSLRLEINGKLVLEITNTNGASGTTKPVRLNKGTNAITADFRSPDQGDAFLRLSWSNKELSRGPIPSKALTHIPTPDLEKANLQRLGRELFVEHRCFKCHAVSSSEPGMLELAMDAPTFEGIGSRRNDAWLARWILDPKAERPRARMPKLLRGASAKEDAEAIAGFLASLKSAQAPPVPERKASSDDAVESGRKLFESMHCAACHLSPESQELVKDKISLQQVGEKFSPGALSAFLQKPDMHYAWIRMPNFKLTDDETLQLAIYLDARAAKPREGSAPNEASTIERGRKLVQTAGCLNCHGLKLENQSATKLLSELPPEKWNQGCLAPVVEASSNSPQFDLSAAEREGLQAFARTDRSSLSRHGPADFAARQTRLLNCRECHGKFDGFPPLDILGERLKPEWSRAFIAGEVPDKPRPWLEARMPIFSMRAEALARGLAMEHGFPPQTPAEPPVDMDAAKIGQKLVSAAGGFSCISCHAVGAMGAAQVFETPGINFAQSGERLRKDYFQRWVRNPIQIDPTTKMPVYFDEEGRSPLTEFYDGDGAKQIDALWEYIRLGNRIPPPAQ